MVAPLLILATSTVAALVFWLIYSNVLVLRGPFLGDEGVHALKGVQFADSLRNGDWLGFLLDSYRQVLYPPLHSWVMAIAYLVAGPSVLSAGMVGLLSFVLMAPVLFLAGYFLHNEEGAVAGTIAAFLLLTSPPLMSFSTQIMREVPGLLTICLTILTYIWLVRGQRSPRAYMLLGLGVIVTYFVRMPYGVFIFLVIMVAWLVDVKFNPLKLWRRDVFFFLLPLVVVFGIWFLYPPKLASTWMWLLNEPNVPEPYALAGWLFYPLSVVRLSASAWHFALAMVAVIFALARFRHHRGIRFLLVLVFVQMLLAEFHPNKQQRYIFPMLPALFLLSAFALAEFWRWARAARQPFVRWLPLLIVAALVFYGGGIFARTLVEMNEDVVDDAWRNRRITAVHATITEVVAQTGTTLIIGSMDMTNPTPALLDWHLISETGQMGAQMGGSLAQIDEERRILSLVRRLPLPGWWMGEFERVLTRSDMPNRTRTLYIELPLRASYSQSQEGLTDFLRELMAVSAFDGVVVLTVDAERPKYPLAYIAPSLEAVGLAHDVERSTTSEHYFIDVFR